MIWLVGRFIRPNIMFVIHCLTQFMHNQLRPHLQATMHIYATLSVLLINAFFPFHNDFMLRLIATLIGWVVPLASLHSSFLVLVIRVLPENLKSKDCFSFHYKGAEYLSVAHRTTELVWCLLLDLGISCPSPITLKCDKVAFQIATNPVFMGGQNI